MKMTQAQFAKYRGVSPGYISKLIKSETIPPAVWTWGKRKGKKVRLIDVDSADQILLERVDSKLTKTDKKAAAHDKNKKSMVGDNGDDVIIDPAADQTDELFDRPKATAEQAQAIKKFGYDKLSLQELKAEQLRIRNASERLKLSAEDGSMIPREDVDNILEPTLHLLRHTILTMLPDTLNTKIAGMTDPHEIGATLQEYVRAAFWKAHAAQNKLLNIRSALQTAIREKRGRNNGLFKG